MKEVKGNQNHIDPLKHRGFQITDHIHYRKLTFAQIIGAIKKIKRLQI